MKRQIWKKILLVLLLAAVFLPVGNVGATLITITDGDKLTVNLEVTTGPGTGSNTLYSYQLENIGILPITTFQLSFLLGTANPTPPPDYVGPVAGVSQEDGEKKPVDSGTVVAIGDPNTSSAFTASWAFAGEGLTSDPSANLSWVMTLESSIAPNQSGDPLLALIPGFGGSIQVEGPGIYARIDGGTTNPVPEPGTLLLLGSGLLLGGFKLRRKKK